MSIEKNMNTRIQHKHDTEANWNKAINFIPKQSELIVYDIDNTYSYERFKIGDGKTLVNNLPFVVIASDWNQTDATKNDYIKNKPTLGAMATKDEVSKVDLANDVQESLNKANTAIQSVDGLATETYVGEQIAKIPTPDISGQISTHNTSTTAHNDIRAAIPTKISDLSNDIGYITEAPDEIYVGNGDMPETATIQILMDGSDEEQEMMDELKEYIDGELAVELAKRGQLKPEFANDISECTDTTKLYVLPDGYIYGYIFVEGEGSINLIPFAEELTSTSPYNGVGYKDGYYASSSSPHESSKTGCVVTGLIPVSSAMSKFDLYVKGISLVDTTNGAERVLLFNSSKTVITSFYVPQCTTTNCTITKLADNYYKYSFNLSSYSQTAYIKLSCTGSGKDMIVTLNEPIEESSGGEYKWTNTGRAFVPTDYEDRIVVLETENSLLKSFNTSLQTRVKALEDSMIMDSSVPEYVLTEAEEVADKVLAVRNAGSFVMALASDFHTNSNDASSVSVLHAGQGMNAINSMTQLDLVALLGDYEIRGFSYGDNDTDGEDARKSFKHVKKAFSSVATGVPFMMLQGNHDELPADTTEEARQKYYAYIGANNVGTVIDYDNKFRNYGYRDFDNYKIRVIYLNTTDVSDGEVTSSYDISTEQLNWLNTVALNLTDSEWGIIVLSHHPLNWEGDTRLLNALDAYKGKNNGAELIAHFHGHLHNFRAETLGTNGVPTITIPNACFGRNNEYGTSSSYSDSIKTAYGDTDENGNQRQFNKTENTAEDTAFNVIVIDRNGEVGSRKIHCFNYGAGTDREISY